MPNLRLHIDRKSQEYQYAARVLSGESRRNCIESLSVPAETIKYWRESLVNTIETATGNRYPYEVCAFLILLPPEHRDTALYIASTKERQEQLREEFGLPRLG